MNFCIKKHKENHNTIYLSPAGMGIVIKKIKDSKSLQDVGKREFIHYWQTVNQSSQYGKQWKSLAKLGTELQVVQKTITGHVSKGNGLSALKKYHDMPIFATLLQ